MECIKDLWINREDPWAADLLKIEDKIGICIANNTLKKKLLVPLKLERPRNSTIVACRL